jgi:RNA-binding protein YhbY
MSECIIYIEAGRITNQVDIRKKFAELKDGIYQVKVSTRKKRSLSQNAYYWGVVCDMVKQGLYEAGYRSVRTSDDAHEVMKILFLKKRIVNEDTGEVIEIIGSTASLTTEEFIIYIEEIIQWAAEYLGIQIPLPNEII